MPFEGLAFHLLERRKPYPIKLSSKRQKFEKKSDFLAHMLRNVLKIDQTA
jgi:hypothetical protein